MNQLIKDYGCIVLCGGKSSRMGTSKAMLPFGDRTLLQRVIASVENVCSSIVVVAAKDQPLPDLPESVIVVHDSIEGQGPLEGIRVGLNALPQAISAAYVTSCDVPFLKPSFVEFMFDQLGSNEIAVPVEDGFFHPLAGVYSVSVSDAIERLFQAGERRPRMLFDQVCTAQVPTELLKTVDSVLDSLVNLNEPEQYQAALERLHAEE